MLIRALELHYPVIQFLIILITIAKFKRSDSVKYGEGMKSFITLLGGGEWTRTLNCTVMFFTH